MDLRRVTNEFIARSEFQISAGMIQKRGVKSCGQMKIEE